MTTKYPNVAVAVKRTINDSTQSLDLDMKMESIPGEDSLMFAKEAFFSWGISLDLRSLEEQYADPRRTNRVQRVSLDEYIPFAKDHKHKYDKEKNK